MLSPVELRSIIRRDFGGQPLEFPIEPPSLDGLPDELITNHLLNWETLLWQRWNRTDSPKARMVHNAQRVVSEASAWLKRELGKTVQTAESGARIGFLFLGEAERALEDEHQKLDIAESTKNDHWLKALLAPLIRRAPDPTALPDLETSRRRLEKALSRRLNRRAVWIRASLNTVVLTSFIWAAYMICGPAVETVLLERQGWSTILVHWLKRIPSSSIGLSLVAALCWFLSLLTFSVYLYSREAAIDRAIDKMIGDIRRKYSALMEQTLRSERESVYSKLRSELASWVGSIENRLMVLDKAADALVNMQEALFEQPSLLTEKLLITPAEWDQLTTNFDQSAINHMGDNFLLKPGREKWQSETTEQLIRSLDDFAEDELREWRRRLDLHTWSLNPNNPDLPILIDELRSQIRPAWPLSREERSEMAAQLKRQAPSTPLIPHPSPLLVMNFLGIPSKGDGERTVLPAVSPREAVFSTADPGRLTYVTTIHALDLIRLPAMERLKAAAQPKSVSCVSDQVSTESEF
jgi:hypothetical protein